MSRHDIATLHPPVSPVSLGNSAMTLASSLDGTVARVTMQHALIGAVQQPCLVVLGGISASRHVAAWWADQVGPGRALDTRHYSVLGIDYLSALPEGWRGVTPHDQAAALAAVLDDLGIARVHALVGASYGGAVALAFAERYPQRLDAALVLSMADRPSPMASALRALQRDLLQFGSAHGCEAQAVAWARALAITTYRSEAEFARRFDGEAQLVDGRWQLPVEGYLRAQGQRFAERFDAESYRVLSESLDLHRIDPASLHTPLYLLAVAQDRLVPQADVEALAAATGGAIASIASEFGHDAFLKEPEAVGCWLAGCLSDMARMQRPSMTA